MAAAAGNGALSHDHWPPTWEQVQCRVLRHEARAGDVYKLTLQAPSIAAANIPGQFVNIRTLPEGRPGWEPLLRRPFSVCEARSEAGSISVIYRRMGKGTAALSLVRPGEVVDVLGPLGNGFPAPPREGRLLLVGGGLGIPPMVAAAGWALRVGVRAEVLLGARSRHLLAGRQEMEATGVPLTITTDDGSLGEPALVTAPLARRLADGGKQVVWACGLEPMLRAVQALCLEHNVECYLCLERYMGCGTGVCVGCTVKKAHAFDYFKVCKEGPVFRAEEVVLHE